MKNIFIYNTYLTPQEIKQRYFVSKRLSFIFSLVLIILKAWFFSLFEKFDYDKCSIVSQNILKSLERIGFSFQISGIENIKNLNRPVIFISNHMSVLETLILPGVIQPFHAMTFIVKNELLSYPFLNKLLNDIKVIPVSRKDTKKDYLIVLKEVEKLINNNISVLIFPQSTRKVQFDPSSFNTLGVKVAYKNNVSIIPIAVATDAWQLGKLIKDFGKFDTSKKVKISFGAAILNNNGHNENHNIVIAFIQNKLKKWHYK